jgi:sulfite exporter TauE/SafE
MDYVVRRLSSLPLVGGAFLALLGVALLESAGVRSPAAIAAGVVVFVASALATELILGDRIRHHLKAPR